MIIRPYLLAAAILSALLTAAAAQSGDDRAAAPVLRASVTVTADVVRIGDVIDNAGAASQIAIYRAPDLGTTGLVPVSQVIAALRSHRVIGVDTRDISEISVTRASRTLATRDIELLIARALERRNGLGEASNISVTFDHEIRVLQLDASNSGDMDPISTRYDSRNGRFDISFEVANEQRVTPKRLRFTGIAIETVEAAILSRNIERNEIVKTADVLIERRPKTEIGADLASRDRAVGMQARKPLRAGQPLRSADLAKPDLVQRDQTVTLTYETAGLYLTMRGKATEGGTEGDIVNVMNLQTKRIVQGTVIGPGQISVVAPAPRRIATAAADPAPVATASIAAAGTSQQPE